MEKTGRLSIRGVLFGTLIVLRIEERDAHGETVWRDAEWDDLAEMGALTLGVTTAEDRSAVPLVLPRAATR